MTTTKAFRTWSGRLDSGTLTTSQVRQFAAAISTVANDEDQRGKRTALTHDECVRLYERVKANPVCLTDKDATRGFDWFFRYASTPQSAGGLGMSTYLTGIIWAHFDHFTFDGEYVASGWNVWPVWTIHLKDAERSDLLRADTLQYYAVPWQARGQGPYGYSDYWWGEEGQQR